MAKEPTLYFGAVVPFTDHLGIRLVRAADGGSQLEWKPAPEHMNSFDVAHGGAVMSLLDVAMATASRSLQPEMGAVTLEMKTSFMRPCAGALRCEGRVMHRTASLAFAEASVLDEGGRLCAHATGTFKYVKRLPTGPRSANGLGVISTD